MCDEMRQAARQMHWQVADGGWLCAQRMCDETRRTRVRKEKIGDRITALQQLVSPFGKSELLYLVLFTSYWESGYGYFPINAEETTFRELIRFCPKNSEGEPPKWTSRLFYALVSVLVILLLRHHAPDEAARAS
ncbi:hypothetical protein KFK09_014867 [Dendrobium nobile]|uniref:Uncharacterized protein n=1 Tax=Dendrobium nobile TaxID=94219 RepID=A0A8T3B4C1_DENNO|nr:hypothetical protein KFK09_014867 [Dendrobium nobile]